MSLIGWDVGGAHLKCALIDAGRVTAAAEIVCPLWQGLDKLDAAFSEAKAQLGDSRLHAVTMTGELSDIFASRGEGVAKLSDLIAATLRGEVRIYGGRDGWLTPGEARGRPEAVGSANWHASASLAAGLRADCLFADMGSTTTDLIPIAGGAIVGRGYTDAERVAAGELIYTGATRSFLMAVVQRVPFRGAWTPVMNEYFASMADVHRILGHLPENADRHPTADGREKSVAASMARLARMVGRDFADAGQAEWRALASFYAEAQLRSVHDAALQVLSARPLPEDASIVAAGSGAFVLERLAARLGRGFEAWDSIVPAAPAVGRMAGVCAPAVAVGLLLAAQGSPP
jgi:probable H4MPT-linked C1 transfer pathway protein